MSQKKTSEPAISIHARQIRAARALLGWSQADLEKKSKVSRATIKRMEGEDATIVKATAANVARIVEVCEAKGVRFLNTEAGGLGVIWEKPAKKDASAKGEPAKDKGGRKEVSSDREEEAPAAAS